MSCSTCGKGKLLLSHTVSTEKHLNFRCCAIVTVIPYAWALSALCRVFMQVVRVEGVCSSVKSIAIPPMDHPLQVFPTSP